MFTIGADPEIFLQRQDGSFKSVIGLLGGDKWVPRKLSEVGHAVLEDNVAVEFNIPACSSLEQFRNEIKFMMEEIKKIIPNDLQYSQDSAVSFPDSELNCDAAWVFGCEPDYNAWKMAENPKPQADDKNLRSCGGHIHVGNDIAKTLPIETVRAMDLFLGVPSVTLDTNGAPRRKLYGGPGAFRFKPYGVEYRTLSNFWIFSDKLIEWAYTGTQRALEFVSNGKEIPVEHGELIQRCITASDMNAYKELNAIYQV